MALNRLGLCLIAVVSAGIAIASLAPQNASADTPRTTRDHDALMAISSGSHLQLVRAEVPSPVRTAPKIMRCQHVVTIVGVQFGLRCTRA